MPISISSNPYKPEAISFTVMNVGNISNAMHHLEVGDTIGLRGPFGNGFPIQRFRKKDIAFISGGCGLAPLKSAIEAVTTKSEMFGKKNVFFGCKSPEHLLFASELENWSRRHDFSVFITVDNPTPEWKGSTGLVTSLFGKANLPVEHSVALICGPPVMMHFAIIELKKLGFKPGQIYASLERLMQCGQGKCAHCNICDKYACIDGPVFTGEELEKMPLEDAP
jgi:NAD(P)H-flavin reductase